MGFVVFVAMGIYLLISVGVVAWAIRHAKKNGKSAKKLGLGAALVMYMIPFWDWIPTVAVHKHYCEKEAGFWVYKTLDQWKVENPGVMETLVYNNGLVRQSVGDMENYVDTSILNARFNWVVKHNGQFPFNRWQHEQEVIDTKNSEVLARYVDFSTSQEPRKAGWSGWKFWLDSRHCSGGERNDSLMWKFTEKFLGAKK